MQSDLRKENIGLAKENTQMRARILRLEAMLDSQAAVAV
jgi:hypothetical protein